MEDKGFVIYSDSGVYLGGDLRNGCLSLESEVYGYIDSEAHFTLDKENTQKLMYGLALDTLIAIGKEQRSSGIIDLLKKYGIDYNYMVI